MGVSRRSAAAGVLALAVALVSSGVALRTYFATPKRFVFPDAFYYAEMGRQLARGEGFSSLQAYPLLLSWLERAGLGVQPPWPNVSRFPLITLIYAGPFVAFGASEETVLGIGVAFLVGTSVLTFLLGARLFGVAAGTLAALLVATNLSQLAYAVSGLLETPAAFFTTAVALAVVAALDADPGTRRARRIGTALGALLGLAFLLRYDLVALAAGAALVLPLRHGRRCLPLLACVALGGALVVAPWVARNLASFGSPAAFLGLDRNVLWSRATGDPYASWDHGSLWERLAGSPELLEAKVASLAWPVRHWSILFGWRLEILGPAFVVAGAALAVLRHPALLGWLFVTSAFLVRWLIFSLTHHEPRFYASFAPVLLAFTTGAAWLLVERAARGRRVLRRAAFAALAALLLLVTLPKPRGAAEASGKPRPPREPGAAQYAVLHARTPPDALIATAFPEGVAWYGERPSLSIPPALVRDLEERGLRVAGLLYRASGRRHVEQALRKQGLAGDFAIAHVGPASILWLRTGKPAERAVMPGTSRSPSP